MGTWGPHSFDNDAALDWAARYREAGLPLAAETVQAALSAYLGDDGLEADLACEGVAAVEAVCLAMGNGSDAAAEALAGAPQGDAEAAQKLKQDCTYLIMSVAGGSELATLWEEMDWDEREAWLDSLRDIQARLAAEAPAANKPAKLAKGTVTSEKPAALTDEQMFIDLRNAIGGLQSDIAMLKLDMEENFARLSRKMEKISQ